ncbi:hypothetical protein N5F13_15005 [Comamonas thiooxydans]|uniref:hypothetical protein n=1 Tax=Comamonas thiooxydans TaxID=363952 RepID=UPI002447B773|nr:hypothetical protein [Comamonas thiooxydans]MDH1475816.1 hypothetical protein [Comamonas thiooxydans]
MSIKKNSGRQELVVAYLDIAFSDVTAYGLAEDAIEIPGNAVITGGEIVVTEAWNSATSATLKLGDAADDDRYTAAAVDLKTLGRTALTLTGFKHATTESLKALLAQAGAAATKGKARIAVNYYVEGRASFAQG